jgi:hypothetical protein
MWLVDRWERNTVCSTYNIQKQKQTPWAESASEIYLPSDRRLSAKIEPTFRDRGCHVVSVTDPYGHTLVFLARSRYFFFQVAPQLYSRVWVDPVPDPLLLRKSGSIGNRTRTYGSVTRNSDHQTTEAVYFLLYNIYIYDRLCGLVVRVLGYRSGGPGSIPGTNRKKKI